MNCVESRKLLSAHLDGELDPANSLELGRHLQACPACAGRADSIQNLKHALQEPSLRYHAPASLHRQVQRVTRSQNDSPPGFEFARLWKWVALGMTAVAALLLVVRPGGISEHDQFLSEAVSAHVRSLMAEHITDVVSSDQHTVKPWFNGKLDFAPEVKDFAAEGFPLVGGRLDYLDKRTVAALVYRRNKHFINVFVWPSTASNKDKRTTENYRGYSIVNRTTADLHYCLVSDLNEKELTELADLIQK